MGGRTESSSFREEGRCSLSSSGLVRNLSRFKDTAMIYSKGLIMTSRSMTQSTALFGQSPRPWRPHAYQKRAVKFLLEHACAALLLDPGLGKTSIVLAALKMLIKARVVKKVLLVAPLRVCLSTWPGEIEKWSDFSELKIVVLHGPKKDQLLNEDADIYVINPEGLDWLLKPTKARSARGRVSVDVDVRRFKAMGFDTLVLDELTKFKNSQSIRFKSMKLVLGTFGRRWGLTGSLAANGLMDLFGQIYMLDEGRSLGRYITHYRNEFFVPDYTGFAYTPVEGAEEKIYARLAPISLRMEDRDYLDMPQLINNDIMIDLPPSAREAYDLLEDELVSAVSDGVVTAASAGVAMGKCRQMASGGVFADPEIDAEGLRKIPRKRKVLDLHDVKTDALEELVEELQGAPLLIGYEFHHDKARIKARFPQCVFVDEVPAKDFKRLEERWNRGEISMLASHPASIAWGLNLQQRGHHVAFYTLPWDYELYDQFIRRVLRQGNKSRRVFVHRIMARDTVEDCVVAPALSAKRKGQANLFAGIRKFADGRRRRHLSDK